jgi:hypothetical protein
MFDSLWKIVGVLLQALDSQGRRVEELERRVSELERRLQERDGPTTPDFLKVVTSPRIRPEDIFRVPTFATALGLTIYERGKPPRIHVFERSRPYILGVDLARQGSDRTVVVMLKREASPDGDFRSRFVNLWPVEKESEK